MKQYTVDELEILSMKMIAKHQLFFITDLIAFLPISRSTFYNLGLDKLDTIKDAMEKTMIERKIKLRNRWFESENATLQMGLMKLISTDDERKKLSQSFNDITTKGETINDAIDYSKLSLETLLDLKRNTIENDSQSD